MWGVVFCCSHTLALGNLQRAKCRGVAIEGGSVGFKTSEPLGPQGLVRGSVDRPEREKGEGGSMAHARQSRAA